MFHTAWLIVIGIGLLWATDAQWNEPTTTAKSADSAAHAPEQPRGPIQPTTSAASILLTNRAATTCDKNVPWTHAYVAEHLGIKPNELRRLLRRTGLTLDQVCSRPINAITPDLKALVAPKRVEGEAHAATEYMMLRRRGSDGKIDPSGYSRALQHRSQMLAAQAKSAASASDSLVWQSLGPGNIGGRVRAILPSKMVPGRILAGGVSGGIWVTNDDGASWEPVDDFMGNLAITCLVEDPNNSQVIYACTGESFGATVGLSTGLGIYRSGDGGRTWAQLPSTDPTRSFSTGWFFNQVNRIAVSSQAAGTIVAGTSAGLFVSVDGGAVWERTFQSQIADVRASMSGPRFLAGDKDGNVYVSSDNARSWQVKSLAPSGRVEVAIARGNPAVMYASVNFNGGEIHRSTDGGLTWTMQSRARHLCFGSSCQGWYDNMIWIDPTNSDHVLVGGIILWRSVDGGATLVQYEQHPHPDHHIVVEHPGFNGTTNRRIYSGNDGGIHALNDVTATNGAWESLNNNLAITQFYSATGLLDALGNVRVAGGTQDNGTVGNHPGDGLWQKVFGGDGGQPSFDPFDPTRMYGTFQWLGVLRTVPANSSICGNLSDGTCAGAGSGGGVTFIAPVALDAQNNRHFYAASQRLWRTRDAREHSPIWDVVMNTRVTSDSIGYFALGETDARLWVAYSLGTLVATNDRFVERPVWRDVHAPRNNRTPLSLLLDRQSPRRAFLGLSGYEPNGLLMTEDDGLTWRSIANGLPAAPISKIAQHPKRPDWLYVATEVGIFTSQNYGASWAALAHGPANTDVTDLLWLDDARLVAATYGRGLFVATINPPSVAGKLMLERTESVLARGDPLQVKVNRAGGSLGAASVRYRVSPAAATVGGACAPPCEATGQISWASGETGVKTVSIPTINDPNRAPFETVEIALNSAVGASLGVAQTERISIVNRFPASDAYPTGWTTPAGATSGWRLVSGNCYEGAACLATEFVRRGERTSTEFSTELSAAKWLKFMYRSQAQYGDSFAITINGSRTELGTAPAWKFFEQKLEPGRHVISFEFAKRAEFASPHDGARIDAVTFAQSATGTHRLGYSVSSLDFGVWDRESASQKLTLSNFGAADVTLASLKSPPRFPILSNQCGTVVRVGTTCDVLLSFLPTAVFAADEALVIAHSADRLPLRVDLFGTASASALPALSHTSLDFDTKRVGGMGRRVVSLLNPTDSTIKVASIKTLPPFLAETYYGLDGVVVPAHGRLDITVTHFAHVPGEVRGELQVTLRGQSSPLKASLVGSGYANGFLQISPHHLNFDAPGVEVGESASKRVTLFNGNSEAVSIVGVEFSPVDPTISVRETTCESGKMLQPNATCTIDVAFTPANHGYSAASLRVSTSAGMRESAISAVANRKPYLNPTAIEFGRTPADAEPTFSISAYSPSQNYESRLANVSVTAPFRIVSDACTESNLLAGPNTSCEVSVGLQRPLVPGRYSGTLTINRYGAASITAAVSAEIVPANTVEATPVSLDFGTRLAGGSYDRSLTLKSATATISAITTTGPFEAVGCVNVALTGAGCLVTVRYRPTRVGSDQGMLTATGAGVRLAVPLRGEGQADIVSHYYGSILRRPADSGGAAFWRAEVARMGALGVDAHEAYRALAIAFFQSAEYRARAPFNEAFVEDLFQTFFARPADASGRQYWADQLLTGIPRDVVLMSFLFSPEFLGFMDAILGRPTARAEANMVVDFYRAALGRLPDSAGFDYWAGLLRRAQCEIPPSTALIERTADDMSSLFFLSSEYQGRMRTNREFIADAYNGFLRRGGDTAGVLYWINELETGRVSRSAIRRAFKDSPEFQARVAQVAAAGCAR